MASFAKKIESRENLILITTCRTSYADYIFDSSALKNTHQLYGFDDETVEVAVKKYFAKYKLTSHLSYAALERFKHPIFLRIFCELKNPTRRHFIDVRAEEETTFEIFERYLERINEQLLVSKTNILRPHENFVQTSLKK